MARHLTFATNLLGCLFLGALTGALGCSDASLNMPPDETENENLPAATATYHSDIKPLMARYCVGCHKSGEIAPFSLDSYKAVQSRVALITAAVKSGAMPPWLPSEEGLPLHYERKLRPQDQKLLLDWLAAGAPEGDATATPRSDFPPAEQATPPRPDLKLELKTPYRPNAKDGGDDYRCFVFDPMLDRDRYLTAGEVKPDNRSIVHHVVVYMIPPEKAAAAQMQDKGDGYTCFGGPGVSGAIPAITVSWAPGAPSMRTPEGTAFKLPKGAVLVLQMHYNTITDNGKGDATGVVLELTDTPPKHELLNLIMAKPNLLIKANDANSHQEQGAPVSIITKQLKLPMSDLTVYGAFPHMHLLGKHINVSVVGGVTAMDIPRWDFHWQGTYMFKEPWTLKQTDILSIACDYDNSAANQPMVNGMPRVPQDVTWGEGTLEEMCVSLLLVSAK
jgi:hypothetical protein